MKNLLEAFGDKYAYLKRGATTSLCLKEFSEENFLENIKFPEVLNNIGRGAVAFYELKSSGRVVARRYLRGGFARKVSDDLFFNFSCEPARSRPIRELFVLNVLHEAGVRVPKPVAAYVEELLFGLAYRGFIVTGEITGAVNLLELAPRICPVELRQIMRAAGAEAKKCLELGVQHVDLHVGNVIVAGEKVFLLDFD